MRLLDHMVTVFLEFLKNSIPGRELGGSFKRESIYVYI